MSLGFPSWLMSREWHDQQRRWEKENRERAIRNALPWDQVKPPTKPYTFGVKADTYLIENPLLDLFPEVERAPGIISTDFNASKALSPSGAFVYRRNLLPRGEALSVPIGIGRDHHAEVVFDAEIEVPCLYERCNWSCHGWSVWMSMTPMEVWTQRTGISFSKGTVVVGGLGMGWLLAQVCKRKQVKNVIVIEKSQELLDWYGTKLCAGFPKVSEVICGDVYDHLPALHEKCKNTRFVLDIWKSYGEARDDRKLYLARKAGMDIWAWGSARGGTDCGY